MSRYPYIIKFPKIGSNDFGFISVAEKNNLPFEPKRIYWTYSISENTERGSHSHKNLEQILIALNGVIELRIEMVDNKVYDFTLDSPEFGVFIPKLCWRTMKYSNNAVQICIASMEYDENDYIRNYDDFKKYMDN